MDNTPGTTNGGERAGLLDEPAYRRLREIASGFLGRLAPGHTLQATALVHEAYLKLASEDGAVPQLAAEHFVSLAARAMRQVLVDHFRGKSAQKRGGDRQRVTLSEVADIAADDDWVDLLALDEALSELVTLSSRQAEVVEMRFFGGFSMPEIADALHTSVATIEREWRRARAWLRVRLEDRHAES